MQKCDALSFQVGGSFTQEHDSPWERLEGWAQKETLVEAALVAFTTFLVGGLAYTFYNAFQTYQVF